MEATIYKTDSEHAFRRETAVFRQDKHAETRLLKLYPQELRQEFIGIGGAFTEAAAYAVSRMSGEKQEQILEQYFGETGNRYSLCRTHIQSCDFSLGNYAYIDDPQDRELKSFRLDRDKKYLIPLIQAALRKNSGIRLLATPWSPPAFMKTNGDMNRGGSLLASYRGMWADMIARYVLEYRRLGIPITRLTVQNEPNAKQTWDSCLFDADGERDFVCGFLRRTLDQNGLSDVKINIWDHNKERIFERAVQTLSTEQARKDVDGIAFHWYSGDHFEALGLTREHFPDKELIMTEGCVEYSLSPDQDQTRGAERYAHDMIGDFNAGANGYIDWNLVLDRRGGPNHKENFCDAPVMCDPETDTVETKLSFSYIGHFSRFLRPGARKAAVSRWSDCVESVGFVNPDGKRVLIVLNRSGEPHAFRICEGENICPVEMERHSILTACW
jgi:glucosylceramidase